MTTKDVDRVRNPALQLLRKNVEVKKKIILTRRNTIREITEKVGLSYGSCKKKFTNVLDMRTRVNLFQNC